MIERPRRQSVQWIVQFPQHRSFLHWNVNKKRIDPSATTTKTRWIPFQGVTVHSTHVAMPFTLFFHLSLRSCVFSRQNLRKTETIEFRKFDWARPTFQCLPETKIYSATDSARTCSANVDVGDECESSDCSRDSFRFLREEASFCDEKNNGNYGEAKDSNHSSYMGWKMQGRSMMWKTLELFRR